MTDTPPADVEYGLCPTCGGDVEIRRVPIRLHSLTTASTMLVRPSLAVLPQPATVEVRPPVTFQ